MKEVDSPKKKKKVKLDIDSILGDSVLSDKNCKYCGMRLYKSKKHNYHWCSNPDCPKDNRLGLGI